MNFLKPKKVLYHSERMKEWFDTGDTSAPVTVKIDLTNVCNHNCPGCVDADLIADDNNQLKLDLVKELLEDMQQMGVKGINYTGGGEPTSHKEFAEIIRYTAELGLEIGLICNGSLFHMPRIPMEEILKHFTWIRISLDAYDDETHKRTHGTKAKFQRTTDNIRELTRIKQEQNLDVTLGAGYLTNQHEDMDRQVWRFVSICKEIGLDYAQLRPSFGWSGSDYTSISSEEWDKIFSDLREYEDESFKLVIDEGKYKKILSNNIGRCYKTCHAQSFKSTSITARGGVYICCSLSGKNEGLIGNIKQMKFSEIWKCDRRKRILKDLDVGRCPKLCVGDNLNEFLEQIKENEPPHKNFL